MSKLGMRLLSFREIRLKLNDKMLGGFVLGDWHPHLSMEAIDLRVTMAIKTQFAAYLEPTHKAEIIDGC